MNALALYVRDLAAHPLEFAGYYARRAVGATVCRAFGHRQDPIARILGMCVRCIGDVPTAESDALWAGLTERLEDTE